MESNIIERKTRPFLTNTIFLALLLMALTLVAALAGSDRSAQAQLPMSATGDKGKSEPLAPSTAGRIVFARDDLQQAVVNIFV